MLTLAGRSGARVRISALMAGSDTLAATLRQRAATDADLRALDAFGRYRAGYGVAPKR